MSTGGERCRSPRGEFLTLQALIDRGYHPLAFRLMCLQAHYRSELEFTWEGLGAALTRLKRMVMELEKYRHLINLDIYNKDLIEMRMLFAEAIADDLNTSVALTVLEDTLAIQRIEVDQKVALIAEMDAILGLNLLNINRTDLRVRPAKARLDETTIASALAGREAVRASKNYAAADAIREVLMAADVEVMDGDPLGWEWKLA